MKYLLRIGILTIISVVSMPSAFAASSPSAIPTAGSPTLEMEKRLEAIKAMDLNKMSRPERKAIKREVKSIKRKMDSSGGIYISIGAVILIVILLILLL